jgi:hypothetical protein
MHPTSAIGRVLRPCLPPIERADELSLLTPEQRATLYRLTRLSDEEAAAYEAALLAVDEVAA